MFAKFKSFLMKTVKVLTIVVITITALVGALNQEQEGQTV